MALPIVHHPDYVAETPPGHRFPMAKFGRLAALLRAEGHAPDGFHQPEPASRALLTLAHAPAYVDAVLEQRVDRLLERRIGLPITASVARRAQLATAGTLLAARLALRHGAAANTAGGSHHAARDGGAGFCVFNDVAVAAQALLAEGAVRRVLVVDLDVHHGDGTALLFQAEPRVFTFSMHCDANWPLEKPASDLDVPVPPAAGDETYLALLGAHLPRALARAEPDLVFYNAGVDVHRDDRLGKLALSDAGIAARDKLVAQACRAAGAAVAGVIGGGYQDDLDALAWRHSLLHRALAETLV
jgi:acetoin utilization deacetylase AcuC-like enzyme